jgi:DNA-binding NarL/FixJ family response regulator
MTTRGLHIAIVEPSRIIAQGLFSIITEAGRDIRVSRMADFAELQQEMIRHIPGVVIMNPSLIQVDERSFQSLRSEYPDVKWLGLVYAFFDPQLLAFFHGHISINDQPHTIIGIIRQAIQSPRDQAPDAGQELLSERENEVLKLLVTGLANKEIADRLNISTHTVITHRKNITQKTGIKSVSGLTLYAVVKGLISVDHFTE